MEISSEHIVDLIKGQARIEQAVNDAKSSTERGLKFLSDRQDKIDKRVSSVEKKVWYGAGLASAIGFATSFFKH